MTEPLQPPKRKDPLKRSRVGHVPPALRSRAAKALAVRAGLGVFSAAGLHEVRAGNLSAT